MNYIAPRTCKEIREGNVLDYTSASVPLGKFRDESAYVLLGPPGGGKTEEFKKEAEQQKGCYVTARDFITFKELPEWKDATLFIDGLDEMRAGSSDQRTHFDQIRSKLDSLACRRFRLSCREADWLGANDKDNLKKVSLDGEIKILRLEPLSDEDISEILRRNHGVNDSKALISSAKNKGINVLLRNPQSLKMLVSAIVNGELPETRKKTFDLACRELLAEHNEEHMSASNNILGTSSLLDTAGKLCAIYLLTGRSGYSFDNAGTNSEYIDLREIEGEQGIFNYVLRSKLFESEDGIHIPVHRQVAEFLGGRYLAGLIQEGLSVGRILALMTGYDGGVVSELRGLSAWLAAHSPQSRREIIERDPLGTVLYGDIGSFCRCEKQRILNRIAKETEKNPWITQAIGLDPNLEYLATPDMREYFRNALADQEKDDIRQSFVSFLLKALQHGSCIPELTDVLMEIARDDNRRLDIRYYALRAFIRQREKNTKTAAELKTLLADVHTGSVQDPGDELLGLLLIELYPDFLSASDLWGYFRTPKNSNFYGMYYLFWIRLVDRSETLDMLISEFIKRFDQFLEEYKNSGRQFWLFSELRLGMLPRFLETAGEEVFLDDLFLWLWVASDPEVWDSASGEEKRKIRHWLNNNPEIKRTVFRAGMERGVDPEKIFFRFFFSGYGLSSTPPPDFGLWCLEQAVIATDEESVSFFLRKTVEAIKSFKFDKGLSEKTAQEKLADYPFLERQFKELMTEYDLKLSSYEKKNKELQGKAVEVRETHGKQQQARIDEVRSCKEELIENRCPPYLIHELAKVYFGWGEGNTDDSPVDRLSNFLGGDENLVDAVLESFKGSVNRSEVPDETEIINLGKDNRLHYLTLPFLAGLEEVFRNDIESARASMTEKQIRQALAFYYSAPLPTTVLDPQPSWYKGFVSHNPDTVSDVFIKSVRSMIRKDGKAMVSIQYLVLREDHAEVARLATLPILETFPVRCKAQQMDELNYLLRAALLHSDESEFMSLVKKKLSFSSMNVAQCVYWLAAGLFVSPFDFKQKLQTYLTGHERRVRHLGDFMVLFPKEPLAAKLIKRLDVPAIKLLIRLIGSLYKPRSLNSEEAVSSFDKPWQMAELICELVQQLASIRSSNATEALQELLSDDALHSWRSYILDSLHKQKIIRREASFQHHDVNQVLQTLENQKPANAADLAVLTTDILDDLVRNIRNGNTSDWRQYWNIDKNLFEPRTENLCRDALLSDLGTKFAQLGIRAYPEGYYVDDKRSDIRIEYDNYNIPVEIKKSNSRDLWSAIENQLIPKYTRDPETDGYGIYLVFWFGKEYCQPPGEGTRPQDAKELRKRLLDSLSADQKRKISICIIDVQKP